jgi:hypothetical protein
VVDADLRVNAIVGSALKHFGQRPYGTLNMNALTRWRTAFLAAAALLLLAGCGGGGDLSRDDTPAAVNGCSGSDCGSVLIGLTDADGDFLSYVVDVVSLKLTRANGTVVETLPGTTRIDFAQYVDTTELLTAATVPNGAYTQATLRLDFTNAEITVESNGAPVSARPVAVDGSALGVVDVNVLLDPRKRLVVAPGLASVFTLDFNLAATNTADLTTTPATVRVMPALLASLEFNNEKDIRVRGPLLSVDSAAGTYVVDVRPFNDRRIRLGRFTVRTTTDTEFEVNGTMLSGSSGLAALASAGAGTATLAFGTLNRGSRQFTAESVRAGGSVPGAGIDTAIGSVIARSGNTLTLRGATLVRDSDGERFVRGNISINIGDGTKVLKSGMRPSQVLDSSAISVGQLIHAFGNSSAQGDNLTLDATRGRVRLFVTPVFGFVNQANPGTLSIKLDSIGGRRASAFNFAGTGLSAVQDADPSNYEVNTGALDVGRLMLNQPVKLLGFVTPFGAAPPDFEARTAVDFAALPANLSISFGRDGSTAPFTSIDGTGLVLNLMSSAIGATRFISIGPRIIDLRSLPASPRIVGASDDLTAYVIVMRNQSAVFESFADFTADLAQRLNGATATLSLNAAGRFDGDANTFTARNIVVLLK